MERPRPAWLAVLPVCLVLVTPGASSAQRANPQDVFSMSFEDLMKLKVVTAVRAEQDVSRVPASVVVISRDDIRLHGYTSLIEILQNIPGLFLVNQYNWSGVTGFGVRGYYTEGSFSNVVVMVDGSTVLREGYINQYVLARIAPNVEAIDRIEVIRGPMSVIYGENAFFGAINIITLKRDATGPTQVVAVRTGSSSSHDLAVRLEQEAEAVATVLNIGLSRSDGIDVPYTAMTSNPLVPRPNGTRASYLRSAGLADDARTAGQLGSRGFQARLAGDLGRVRFSFGYSSSRAGILWRAPSHSPGGSVVDIAGADVHLQHEWPVSRGVTLNTQIQHARYQSVTRYRLGGDDHFGSSTVRSTLTSVQSDLQVQAGRRLGLTSGVLFEQMSDAGDDVDIPAIPNVGNSSWRLKDGDAIRSYQAFAQARWQARPRVELVAGLRAFHFGDFAYQRLKDQGLATFELKERRTHHAALYSAAQLGSIVSTADRSTLKLLFGSAVTAPNIRQLTTRLDFALTRPDADISSLPDLEPSRITTVEAQYQASPAANVVVTGSAFVNVLHKLIVSSGIVLPDGKYVVVTQNSGRIRTIGMEAMARYRPRPTIEMSAACSLQDSSNREAGYRSIAVPYSPRVQVNGNVVYKVSPRVSAALDGLWIGRMESSWRVTGATPSVGARVSQASPAYVLVGVNGRVERLFESPLHLDLRVTNLLDSHVRYPADPANGWADRGFVGGGREWRIGIGYSF